ncbi:hypothetical protein [Nocardioides sp. CFH 31398]|uniref:hypothetical protein n=1 Tax=Nocardioides sp. CFH 31398 TaxID=2919579 RepID=UPI001F05C3B2|nr:hypothetical protein [Nocardioides sp. CFH 31398]MCH1867870.1 hypothetical protein [Nocardioides sp. CFH 31398]
MLRNILGRVTGAARRPAAGRPAPTAGTRRPVGGTASPDAEIARGAKSVLGGLMRKRRR